MGELESTAVLTQFTTSNRSGRRNAVAELDVDTVDPSGEKLAARFSQMGTEHEHDDASNPDRPSTSKESSSSSH